MGDNTTYKVNDDGSVTVSAQLSEQEQNIIEILRIEKAKGGVFASRRMKKCAIKYAKSVNYPEFKVDKLMLDNYPEDFTNNPRTTALIVCLIIGVVFLCGVAIFAFYTYFEFENVRWTNEQIDACWEYQRTGDVEKYCRVTGRFFSSGDNYRIPIEESEQDVECFKDSRNTHLKEMIGYLCGMGGCLVISFISLKRYRRIIKQINLTNKINTQKYKLTKI